MAIDIVAWVYTSDSNRDYQVGIAKYIADQGGVTPHIGGRAEVAADQLDTLPQGVLPRYAKVFNAGNGKNRTVVCMEQQAPLYTGVVAAINLQDGLGVSASYVRNGTTGERSRRRKVGV